MSKVPGAPAVGVPAVGFGVYVHIPFCTRRCDYCAFATWTDRLHLASRYVAACRAHLRRLGEGAELPEATSVFFGGGTPSLLEPEAVASILAEVRLAPGAEVTLECNPETVTEARLTDFREAGVNRLSFGVQSMDRRVLSSLGRLHDPGSVVGAASAAGATGFGSSYNVDLIFGAAGETLADWGRTLEAVLALDPPPAHVSGYALTVEPGTPLARDPARHPDPDDQADKYLLADQLLASAGYSWYEISNWARPGAECRHNLLYWSQGEYAGIGCAAHSHRVEPVGSPSRDVGSAGGGSAGGGGAGRRWWNVRTPERYIALVGQGVDPVAASEIVSAGQRRLEGLELALRTIKGVPEEALPGWRDDPALQSLVEPGQPGRLVLTRRGRLLANEVAIRLT